MKRLSLHIAQPLTLLMTALALGGGTAHASIAANDNPELMLVVWDPVAKVSFTKDLGLNANTFWITGQQDAGSLTSIAVDNTDVNFAEFLKSSTKAENQRWAVMAVDPGPTLKDGDRRLFTTLKQGDKEGVVNPNWTDMTGMLSGDLKFNTQVIAETWYNGLNFPTSATGAFNTHRSGGAPDYSKHGSSFDTAASKNYFASGNGFRDRAGSGPGDAFQGLFATTNLVGQGSWFYFITSTAGKDLVEVDEFDNLGGNGYWGLAFQSTGKYLLSYTMPAYDPKAKPTSADGKARLSTVDFAAAYGSKQVFLPADEFVGPQPFAFNVSSVPEPSAWARMALGLIGLAGLRKRLAKQKAATPLS